MGRAVDAAAAQRGHERTSTVTREDPSRWDLRGAEVAFEFTNPECAERNVLALLESGVGVVCGSTGWDPGRAAAARAAAVARGALVAAPNFSLGMGLFFRIAGHAAKVLAAAGTYDPFVLEMHHRAKADAPSGTALRLAEVVRRNDSNVQSVRAGALDGRLPDGALHVVGVRAGHEVGTHTVGFEGEDDSIHLTHRAHGRAGAALGAVLAGEWILGRTGSYSFDDVLDALLAGP
jgi:4-hydroxy-tetrahydrodipicolinate reductase